MAQVISADKVFGTDKTGSWRTYAPAMVAVAGALLMLLARIQVGGSFISDGALMMLALAAYLLAALFQLTNLYAPSDMARNIGFWTAAIGVFFNLSSWLVRWVAGYEREIALMRAGEEPRKKAGKKAAKKKAKSPKKKAAKKSSAAKPMKKTSRARKRR